MERVRTQRFAEEVRSGLDLIPPRLLERIGPTHWHEGDIYFSGGYGEPLSENHYASAFSPLHFRGLPADRRCPTICFTGVPWERTLSVDTVVHELGHSLQNALGSYDRRWPWPLWNLVGLPDLPYGLTTYEPDAYHEQFCECMVAWLMPVGTLRERHHGSPERLWESNYGRGWLGWINELAGWPADLPPRSLQA